MERIRIIVPHLITGIFHKTADHRKAITALLDTGSFRVLDLRNHYEVENLEEYIYNRVTPYINIFKTDGCIAGSNKEFQILEYIYQYELCRLDWDFYLYKPDGLEYRIIWRREGTA